MSKFTVKKIAASLVPIPPMGLATLFVDAADNHYKIKLDNNTVETIAFASDVASQVLFYANFSSFPVIGTDENLYIDESLNKLYRWDTSFTAYKLIVNLASDVAYVRNQYSFFLGANVNVLNVEEALDLILFPYTAPSVSLVTVPVGQVREYGNPQVGVTLNATTVKNSNNITIVEFYRGATLINTVSSPIAGGGLETYADGATIGTNTTYTTKVGDGTTLVVSNSVSFIFVYPYYYGVGAPGLNAAQIQALTKLVKAQSDTTTTTSPSNQVYYFAYPASYPALTSILDKNGFETISDYTVSTKSFTMLDASSQTYRVYEFNNLTTQTSFNNTYKH